VPLHPIKFLLMTELKIQRWEKPEPPDERTLRECLRLEGLSPYVWSNAPSDTYAAHTHPYDKVIYVVRGSITWVLPQINQEIETRAGDRLDLPRGTIHAARVGPEGVTCLEAHKD
jgi:quercetin dioxygenase-like cupin family protein